MYVDAFCETSSICMHSSSWYTLPQKTAAFDTIHYLVAVALNFTLKKRDVQQTRVKGIESITRPRVVPNPYIILFLWKTNTLKNILYPFPYNKREGTELKWRGIFYVHKYEWDLKLMKLCLNFRLFLQTLLYLWYFWKKENHSFCILGTHVIEVWKDQRVSEWWQNFISR